LDIQQIISDLKNERERLDRAIAALVETDSQPSASSNRTLTRPRVSAHIQLATANKKTRGDITDERRKRLSESMKQSWAERRKKS
jgi:hypothetical protein